MNTRRRPLVPLTLASGFVALALVSGGCSSSQSPTVGAINRGDSQATHEEQRLAPMAAQRRGLLVAGDGFGRMAYSTPPTVATASADVD